MKFLRAFTGWFPVATKEVRATVLSPRFIVIAAILALAVLAGTYAILPGAGLSAAGRVAYGFEYWPDLNRSQPALAMFVTSPSGAPLSGVMVDLAVQEGRDVSVVDAKPTEQGWARFEDLAGPYPNHSLLLFLADEPGRSYASAITDPNFGYVPRENTGLLRARFVPLGVSDRQVVSLVFMDSRGGPVVGADVYIWKPDRPIDPGPEEIVPPGGWGPYRNGTTGSNGYYLRSDPLAPAEYYVHARQGNLNATTPVSFFANANPFIRGPDGVLAFVGATFLSFLLPIVALVLGYDAVARERSEGSLDLLLSKPVSRLGVAIGKLTGAFGSAAFPVVIVLSASSLLIWLQSGSAPTAAFMGAFLATALFALLAYTLVFLAISALVKNIGTALLISVLLSLLFTFFWGLISLLVANLFAPPGSPQWFDFRAALFLATPTGVYQQWLTLSLPALAGGFFGPIGGTAAILPSAWTAAASFVWIAGPLFLFLWTVKYRLGEN